jgi:tetratricopeptide (TPR) repeat protein
MAKRRSKRPRQTREATEQAPVAPKGRLGIILGLLVVTAVVYSPVRDHEFVNYDDPYYVAENAHVADGLTTEGLRWALTSFEDGNWFPLTWASHMLDVELFGLDSGAHHLTSVALHLGSTLLLFGLLLTMTGARWPSALVAFVFALHPQHVESVTWIAERKDVLSGLFWMLTLWAYVWYVRRLTWSTYLVVIVAFALGLMTKAMIVTLPVALLLLDVWPLGRLAGSSGEASGDLQKPRGTQRTWGGLVREKLPLVALAAGASIVTYAAQAGVGAVSSLDVIPLGTRMANATVSYAAYLVDMVWPSGLAVFYPHLLSIPWWQLVPAFVVLVGISWAVNRMRHDRPYMVVGWLWYLLILIPVSGIFQLGAQARADRYMYIPSIGIAVMLAWGLADLCIRHPAWRRAIVGAAVAACAVLTILTWRQVQHWQDSTTLFQHAVDVTEGNYVAHNNLGLALRERGQVEAAMAHYEAAITINPRHAASHNNLGEILLGLGRASEAVPRFEQARRLQPDLQDAHVNLGSAYSSLGRIDEAVAQYRDIIRRWPEFGPGLRRRPLQPRTRADVDRSCRGRGAGVRGGDPPAADGRRSPLQPRERAGGDEPLRRGRRRLQHGDATQARLCQGLREPRDHAGTYGRPRRRHRPVSGGAAHRSGHGRDSGEPGLRAVDSLRYRQRHRVCS